MAFARIFQKFVQSLSLFLAVLEAIHPVAEARTTTQSAGVPDDVLARCPDAQRLSVELVVLVQVLQQQAADLPHGRIRLDGAGAQIRADLAENPGPALCGAT